MMKSKQDKIGRKEIVEKISLLVDNLQKDEHFCLALTGVWGSGKSFVLDMIEDSLREHKEYFIIKYDAWTNSFYPDPLIAILSCVIDSMQEKMKEIRGYGKIIKELGIEKGKTLLVELSKKTGKLGTIACIVKAITDIIPKFKNTYLFADDESVSNFKSYQNLLTEVKTNLNVLTSYKEYQGKQIKLIILVDEIDRCLPDEQLKILERLHHLFDIKNCIVICAINKEAIKKNFNVQYGENGEDYLRKFFDFTFNLQPESESYMKNMFENIKNSFAKITSQSNNFSVITQVAYEWITFGNEKVLQKVDNRELYRYFHNLNDLINAYGWDKFREIDLLFAIIGLFIVRFLDKDFLSKQSIDLMQEKRNEEITMALRNNLRQREMMPYHDYILDFFGVNRESLPKEIRDKYLYGGSGHAESIWYFNEAVSFSTGRKFAYNEMRAFNGGKTVNTEAYQELRKLIILYGGGVD